MSDSLQGPLLLVGGWGVVGAQAARLLRRRHPDLRMVLAGRDTSRGLALAAELGADIQTVDVSRPDPLAALPERPGAILAAVSDPGDHLLVNALRLGVPYADINRAGQTAILDAGLAVARHRSGSPVLLSGSWLAGLSVLCAFAVIEELDGDCDRIDVVSLSSSDDRVGADSWGFSERLPWPYWTMTGGRRQVRQPLSHVRSMRCADGHDRPAALVATLEQLTLPVTLDVPTVETRIALRSTATLVALMVLKRIGALRLLMHPALRTAKRALLERTGDGDTTGISVVGTSPSGRTVRVDLLDARGQSHLSAVGAVCAAEQLLSGSLPAGVSFPEQYADSAHDLEIVLETGISVDLEGFRPASLGLADQDIA